MRIGFRVGPLYFSSSTRRRRSRSSRPLTAKDFKDIFKFIAGIILLPICLIENIVKFIIWIFTRKTKKLLKELEAPRITSLDGIKDDRQRPPVNPGQLSKEEYDAQWNKWRQSQEAIMMLKDYKQRKDALPLLEEATCTFPNSKYIKYAKVLAMHYQGRNVEAHNLLKYLPDVMGFNSLKIDLAIAAKDYNVALQSISKLPMSSQLYADMIFKHANCLIELKEWNAALNVLANFNYRKNSNKGWSTSMWHYLRGLCYEGMGQIRSAIQEYEKILSYPLKEFNVAEKLNTLRQTIGN